MTFLRDVQKLPRKRPLSVALTDPVYSRRDSFSFFFLATGLLIRPLPPQMAQGGG